MLVVAMIMLPVAALTFAAAPTPSRSPFLIASASVNQR
jgi:hypothetical protein